MGWELITKKSHSGFQSNLMTFPVISFILLNILEFQLIQSSKKTLTSLESLKDILLLLIIKRALKNKTIVKIIKNFILTYITR